MEPRNFGEIMLDSVATWRWEAQHFLDLARETEIAEVRANRVSAARRRWHRMIQCKRDAAEYFAEMKEQNQ